MGSLRVAAAVAVALAVPAAGASGPLAASRTVEVVQVEGILDAASGRAVRAAIRVAEHERAEAVVLQIDSPGAADVRAAERLVDDVLRARVPVISWVGPPGSRAERSAAFLVLAASFAAIAPGSRLGSAGLGPLDASSRAGRVVRPPAGARRQAPSPFYSRDYSAEGAEAEGLVDLTALELPDLLKKANGLEAVVSGTRHRLHTDPDGLTVRFRKLDIPGRVTHAAAKPSISYLFLLLGLVGLVFEAFHPSTGPAGIAGLAALALSAYGIVALHGSWLGAGLILAGVALFGVDLRFESLGVFTLLGLAGLVSGTLLLFPHPALRVSPWMMAFGVLGMVAFLLGAMTRVLRDLRSIARGELQVRDPHPH